MRHDWVFDVLQDLKAFADSNGLPELSASVEQAMAVARSEIEARTKGGAAVPGPMVQGRSRQTH